MYETMCCVNDYQRTNHIAVMCWNGPNAASAPEKYKIKIQMTQQTRVIILERPKKMPRQPSSRIFYTKITATPLVTHNTRNSILNIRPSFHHTYESKCKGFPSSVRQQQIETAYLKRYNNTSSIKREIHQNTPKQNLSS